MKLFIRLPTTGNACMYGTHIQDVSNKPEFLGDGAILNNFFARRKKKEECIVAWLLSLRTVVGWWGWCSRHVHTKLSYRWWGKDKSQVDVIHEKMEMKFCLGFSLDFRLSFYSGLCVFQRSWTGYIFTVRRFPKVCVCMRIAEQQLLYIVYWDRDTRFVIL